MNEIMKTLTIISAIFIPLTFIAGIYGMNLNTCLNCIETYFAVIGVMVLIVWE
jgi:magnesium transporter